MSQTKHQTDSMLYCVGIVVDQHLRSPENQDVADSVNLDLSYLTLAWLGMKEAFQCWQIELAEISGIQDFDIHALRVDTFLNDRYSQFPEFQYLINLKQAPNSWLDILLKKTARAGELSILGSQLKSSGASNSGSNTNQIQRIELTNISETNEESTKEQFLKVYAQLQAYIFNVRERQQEW